MSEIKRINSFDDTDWTDFVEECKDRVEKDNTEKLYARGTKNFEAFVREDISEKIATKKATKDKKLRSKNFHKEEFLNNLSNFLNMKFMPNPEICSTPKYMLLAMEPGKAMMPPKEEEVCFFPLFIHYYISVKASLTIILLI